MTTKNTKFVVFGDSKSELQALLKCHNRNKKLILICVTQTNRHLDHQHKVKCKL